jgi:hypothetical protein
VYHVGTPATKPLERAAAAVLACGQHAYLSQSSAMTHWGFWRNWREPFEVTLMSGNRRRNGICVHRSTILTEEEVTEHHEIPVTKPARTIFDMIARIPRDSRDRTVSRALNTPYLTRGQLEDQLERTPNHPAAHLIVPHVITKNGPTKSDWERELPPYCTRHNLPIPIMGYEIGPNRTVDAFWELGGPVRGIIIELDSVEYHLDRFAFKDDRGRDKDHLALRLPTVRIIWEEMHETPRQEAERLHRIIEAWR